MLALRCCRGFLQLASMLPQHVGAEGPVGAGGPAGAGAGGPAGAAVAQGSRPLRPRHVPCGLRCPPCTSRQTRSTQGCGGGVRVSSSRRCRQCIWRLGNPGGKTRLWRWCQRVRVQVMKICIINNTPWTAHTRPGLRTLSFNARTREATHQPMLHRRRVEQPPQCCRLCPRRVWCIRRRGHAAGVDAHRY